MNCSMKIERPSDIDFIIRINEYTDKVGGNGIYL